MAFGKSAGHSEENLFKKAKVSGRYFVVNQVLMFVLHSTVSLVACLTPLEFCFSKMSTVVFENKFVPTLWLATFVHKQWREFEALHCPTTPNVI
jgi:hypothetical protein